MKILCQIACLLKTLSTVSTQQNITIMKETNNRKTEVNGVKSLQCWWIADSEKFEKGLRTIELSFEKELEKLEMKK